MAATNLARTPSSEGNRGVWTFSTWLKRSDLSTNSATIFSADYNNNGLTYTALYFSNNGTLNIYSQDNTPYWYVKTNKKFNDTSAWYHIVVMLNTADNTALDRVRIYVNGVRETSLDQATMPPKDSTNTWINANLEHNIGRDSRAAGGSVSGTNFGGLMSHIHFCDGQAYDASSFGETDSTTGEWKIKTSPSVTYGTNGFFILKDGNSVTDQSGRGNNWTINNILSKTEDSPSNVFSTINPLYLSKLAFSLIQGNLRTNGTSSNADRSLYGTIGASSGKYYFETKIDDTNSGDSNNIRIGIVSDDQVVQTANNGTFFSTSRGYAYYGQDGSKRNSGNTVSYGNTFTTNDIIGCAFDLDNNKIYWSKNGTWQNSGDPTSGATGTGSAYNLATGYSYLPAISSYYSEDCVSINFGNGYFGATAISSAGTNASGNGIFEYDVPTGYTALSTKGLNL